MYVKRLEIEDFRCFGSAEVELNYPTSGENSKKTLSSIDNVTVFVGKNDVGKTAIFQALSLAILAPVLGGSGIRVDYFMRQPPGNPVIAFFLPSAFLVATLILDLEDAGILEEESMTLFARAEIRRAGGGEVVDIINDNSEAWNNIYLNVSPGFFLAGYGGNRRSANLEGYGERVRSPRYQRVAGLFEDFALVPFSLGYLELAQAGLLNDARLILNSLLPDGLELSEQMDKSKRPLFRSNGVFLPYQALSDAYRSYICWLWDLMVQMVRVQPDADFNVFRDLTGIVMVDEIDLHLHPDLHPLVVRELPAHFPKLQFLFSTNQPTLEHLLEPQNIRYVSHNGESSIIKDHHGYHIS